MRVVLINHTTKFNQDPSSWKFWFEGFEKQCTELLFINHSDWLRQEILNFFPDHIHFGSDALPREMWMPLNKIRKLKEIADKTSCVITSYRGGIGKEECLLNKLNKIVDKAFGSNTYYKNQEWIPAPSNPYFWNQGVKKSKQCGVIFIGHCGKNHVKNMKKWNIEFTKHRTLRKVVNNFKTTVVGNGWETFGIKSAVSTNTYENNRNYYNNSFIGLNIVHDDLKKFPKYWSNRLNHMLQAGLPCFTPYHPGYEEIFKQEENIVWYKSDDELIDFLYKYHRSENLTQLNKIAKAGKRLAFNWNATNAVNKILSVKKSK